MRGCLEPVTGGQRCLRDDSFEFLTASDKWLHNVLHELLAVTLALIIFCVAFQAGLLFCQLNRSAHFLLELQFICFVFFNYDFNFCFVLFCFFQL